MEPVTSEFSKKLFGDERIVSLEARRFLVDHGNTILDTLFALGFGYVWGTLRTLVALRGVTSASFPHIPSVASPSAPGSTVSLARSWRWRTAMHYGSRAGFSAGLMTVLSILNGSYFPSHLWIERYEFQAVSVIGSVVGLLALTRRMFQRTPYWFFPYLLSESNRLDFEYEGDDADEEKEEEDFNFNRGSARGGGDEEEEEDGAFGGRRRRGGGGSWTVRFFKGRREGSNEPPPPPPPASSPNIGNGENGQRQRERRRRGDGEASI